MSYSSPPGFRVALAADHAGYPLKEAIREHLLNRGVRTVDLGTNSTESVDYPDFARRIVVAVLEGEAERGILICGTGVGMAMAANRQRGIRAALCHDHFTASAARRHNNANVLVLGGRILGRDLAMEIVDTWLDTPFEGGRHESRLEKMDEYQVRVERRKGKG